MREGLMSGCGFCSESMVNNVAQLARTLLPSTVRDSGSRRTLDMAKEIAWNVVCADGAQRETFESLGREVADRLVKELEPDKKLHKMTKPVACQNGFATRMFKMRCKN